MRLRPSEKVEKIKVSSMATRANLKRRLVTVSYGFDVAHASYGRNLLHFTRKLARFPTSGDLAGDLCSIHDIRRAGDATRLFACLAFSTLSVPFYLFETYLLLTETTNLSARSDTSKNLGRTGLI